MRITYTNTATGQSHDCGWAPCNDQQALEWVLDHGMTAPGDLIQLEGWPLFQLEPDKSLTTLGRVARC
jgi:hypothetical protein